MASNALFALFGAWALTYLVHSTLFLTTAWLLCRRVVSSHVLCERAWKSAAVLGMITSLLAAFAGWGVSIGVPTTARVASVPPAESPVDTPSEFDDSGECVIVAETASDRDRQRNNATETLSSRSEIMTSPKAGSPLAVGSPFQRLQEPDDASSALDASSVLAQPQLRPVDDISPEEFAAIEAQLAAEQANAGVSVESNPAPGWENTAPALRYPAADLLVTPQRLRYLTELLGAIVACWIALGLLRMTRQELALGRLLRMCRVNASGDAPRLLAELLQQSASRGPSLRKCDRALFCRLLISDQIAEPLACGVWNPTIVLPTGCDERLDTEELRALLAHELAHLQRGDTVWLWIGRVLCSSFVFQPLNLVARRGWQAAAEVQCDDWAVEQDVSVVSLASCLAHVAEWRLDRMTCPVLTATSNGGPLTLRIERLLGDRPADVWKTRWRSCCCLLASLVLGIGFASVAPKLDRSLWAHTPDADLAARLRLWDEITTDLSAIRADLDRLAPAAETHSDPAVRTHFQRLQNRIPPP